MITRRSVGQAVALAAMALMALSACNSSPKQENWDLYNGEVPIPGSRPMAVATPPRQEPPPTRVEPRPEPVRAPEPMSNVLYIPTGERTGSGLMVEKRVPTEVIAGQEFAYDIIATNLTNTALDDVIITDTFGPNFKFISSEPSGDVQGQTARWGLGSLPGKGSRTIHVRASAGQPGQISSCASGSYSLALCSAINVVQPALKLAKQAPSEVLICDNIPIRLTVTNTGTGMARNVHVRDALPQGLATLDGKTSIDLDAGNLNAGQSKDFNITTKASKTGTYTNSSTAVAEGGLTAESNQTRTIVRQPVLALACQAPKQVFIGREATFEFTVRNTGDIACNATINMPMPSGASFVSATAGGTGAANGVTWNVGSLAPNSNKVVSVTLRPSAGTVNVNATAECACATSASTSCATTVVGVPALLLDGFDNPDPIEIGNTTTYSLTVTNQGTTNLTNVQLLCTMDEANVMEYVSATGATPTVSGKSITFPAIATLAPGAKQTYTITVRAKAEGQVQFRADAKSNEITRPLVKIETTNFYK